MRLLANVVKSIVLGIAIVMIVSCGGAEERKAKYLEKGKMYLEEGNVDKARIEFKNTLQIDTKFPQGYYYMGRVEERNKELRKAIGNYLKAVELDPTYLDPKIRLAKLYAVVNTKEYLDKAREMVDQILILDQSNPDALLTKATLDYKEGDKEAAVARIENIVKENKQLEEGFSLLSTIYTSRDELDKAIKVLEEGVANNNKSIKLRLSLAKLYVEKKLHNQAEDQLKEVIKTDPEDFNYKIALFSFYATTNRLDDAENVLKDAINQDDEDAKRYLVLIEFIAQRKSIGEAEAQLLKFIENKPDLYELKFALFEFYKKIDEIEKGVDVLNQIINDRQDSSDAVKAKILLASVYVNGMKIDKAQALIDQVLQEYPNNSDALLVSGRISVIKKKPQDAINALRTVIKTQPKNTEASSLLASAHMMSNEIVLAEDVLKTALTADPMNHNSHINYAKYLVSTKRIEEAKSVIDKALIYFKDNYDLLDFKATLAILDKDVETYASLLNKMISVEPGRPGAYIKRGKYYYSLGKLEEAISEFENAADRMSNKFQPLELIVNAYLAKDMPDKAMKRMQDQINKKDDDPMAYLLIGKIYEKK